MFAIAGIGLSLIVVNLSWIACHDRSHALVTHCRILNVYRGQETGTINIQICPDLWGGRISKIVPVYFLPFR